MIFPLILIVLLLNSIVLNYFATLFIPEDQNNSWKKIHDDFACFSDELIKRFNKISTNRDCRRNFFLAKKKSRYGNVMQHNKM